MHRTADYIAAYRELARMCRDRGDVRGLENAERAIAQLIEIELGRVGLKPIA